MICAVRDEDTRPSLALPETKRRRLGTKTKPDETFAHSPPSETLKAVVEHIENLTPRVGKKVFQQGDIVSQVQQLFPDMQIKVIESCRGVDRKRELPIPATPQLLPFRRTFGRRRQDLSIYCDPEWERWDKLSKRQIRRAGIPSKIAITVFADKQNEHPTISETREAEPNVSKAIEHDKPTLDDEKIAKRVRFHDPLMDKSPADTMELQTGQTVPADLTCPPATTDQKSMPTHGPMFRKNFQHPCNK